ncbi:hypothetical protein SELMODRAFT_404186 [Selaginella moellendorffii]|uniref:Peptidase S8/S53 domain-containing protein n=1 Tax=Selaginella moellendorffii TaxID=88036 RepID=D8QUJ2_SELML|nr:hypothetical protein SELMODRAFT_404186 [Selaginella moellendorffii]
MWGMSPEAYLAEAAAKNKEKFFFFTPCWGAIITGDMQWTKDMDFFAGFHPLSGRAGQGLHVGSSVQVGSCVGIWRNQIEYLTRWLTAYAQNCHLKRSCLRLLRRSSKRGKRNACCCCCLGPEAPRSFHIDVADTKITPQDGGVHAASPTSRGSCEGKARGGLPKARIKVYKVCFFGDFMDHPVLTAFDNAVRDGVDILLLSLGGQTVPYDEDTIAIGSFHAMRHGILVSCSAGNSRPLKSTVTNATGLNIKKMKESKYGLVNSVDAALKHSSKDSAWYWYRDLS